MNIAERTKVNNLLALLRQFGVVELVRGKFAEFGNEAPPKMLEWNIAEVEKLVSTSMEATPL